MTFSYFPLPQKSLKISLLSKQNKIKFCGSIPKHQFQRRPKISPNLTCQLLNKSWFLEIRPHPLLIIITVTTSDLEEDILIQCTISVSFTCFIHQRLPSSLPVNGVHEEGSRSCMLQGAVWSRSCLHVASFLFPKYMVFPRLSQLCPTCSTPTAHA